MVQDSFTFQQLQYLSAAVSPSKHVQERSLYLNTYIEHFV